MKQEICWTFPIMGLFGGTGEFTADMPSRWKLQESDMRAMVGFALIILADAGALAADLPEPPIAAMNADAMLARTKPFEDKLNREYVGIAQ